MNGKAKNDVQVISSIPQLHKILGLPEPEHPLISVNGLIKRNNFEALNAKPVVYNFYSICIKKHFKGKVKYGQTNYDHDAGVLSFYAPGQVIATEISEDDGAMGDWLIFHPDLLRSYPLFSRIKEYGFFSYAITEALHLSVKEEQTIEKIWEDIKQEYQSNIDTFSQDVIVSHIDLLLNYCNRFYNRQFITRKKVNNDVLSKFEDLLNEYFEGGKSLHKGLPEVQYFSEKLFVSAQYLSDLLKSLTGMTTQQHIHNRVIELAKNKLMQTRLSVAEIAYELGFEYPQSFNKLFKNKTGITPNEFRNLN
ncbi:helix-turn-helix domain-containing protein [Chitinophaga filiformis]|uniref:helix-turn-helix domain-containing protein n=1 Tax=Chitinophaga filiformis TaxID=104663 RepID=UPI001F2DB2F5|nr:helix-turn-helix domain-containing protein [Chitinophaga filiformis]MCF6406005.1 helix-turn-helix domain-containing protein [Chitinophaga filiformis]